MIRIEIDVQEWGPGKICTVVQVLRACRKRPTNNEKKVAGRLFDMIKAGGVKAAEGLGDVKEIKPEKLEKWMGGVA